MLVVLLALESILGCASTEPVDTVPSPTVEFANTLADAPFLTLSIGPKTLTGDFAPDSVVDSKGRYYACSGDGDGFHRFLTVSKWNPKVYIPEPTSEDIGTWKTEHGFGLDSTLTEVYEAIGLPTTTADVKDFVVQAYKWQYETEFRNGKYPATYQMTIVFEDDLVAAITIDIDELP
jgi:hypothetical protein